MPRSVPVVDLQDYISTEKRAEFIQQLGDAFRYFGFVRIRGHNVTSAVTAPAYRSAKQYFSLSSEVKSKYIIKGGAGQRGYTPYGIESAKNSNIPDLKEFWHVGRELPQDDPLYDDYDNNIWPEEVEPFHNDMLDLYDALEDCSDILLEALALYLGENKDAFTQIIDKGNTILRLLYYPALQGEDIQPGAVRAAEHEDINFITLLVSSSSGLQILTRDDEWVAVEAQEGEIVADAGDMLSRVTNGYIPSTTHRVINPDDLSQERFSMPFFVHPRPDSMLSVLNSCKGDGFPEPPRDIIGIDFLNQRLKALGLTKL
jgi:isopenicillin N synthase-like dioxygenase